MEYILYYLIITWIITVFFKVEPIGAILWGLFPIILPVLYFKRKKKERLEKERKRSDDDFKPKIRHNISSFKHFVVK
jgi:mannose/fructose/N-acetylgalactosamine-specific phosphotransferase system component IIC